MIGVLGGLWGYEQSGIFAAWDAWAWAKLRNIRQFFGEIVRRVRRGAGGRGNKARAALTKWIEDAWETAL